MLNLDELFYKQDSDTWLLKTDCSPGLRIAGIACKWTLAAEAKQYRETLKLQEEMKTNKQLEQEWEQYQKEADPVSLEEILADE